MSKFPGGNIETILIGGDPDSPYTYPVEEATFNLAEQTMEGNERHAGWITFADIRTPAYRKKKHITLNRQSVSIVDAGNLDYLARALVLDEEVSLNSLHCKHAADVKDGIRVPTKQYLAFLDTLQQNPGAINRLLLAQCLGANLVIGDYDGTTEVPDFSALQRGTDFGPYDEESRKFDSDSAVINITRPNPPCNPAGKIIESVYGTDVDDIPRAKEFVATGQGRRGYVGMIVMGGEMAIGQAVRFVPFGE